MEAYLHLRWKIFVDELRLLNEQIKQFSLLLFLFLWTSIPALIYLSLFGIGMIIDNKLPVAQLLIVVWFFIFIQAVLLIPLQSAIFGVRYSLFLNSLHPGRSSKQACSACLSALCQPFLLLSVIVILFIPISRWGEIVHVLLFVFLQLTIIALFITRFSSLIVYLVISFVYLLLMQFVAQQLKMDLRDHLIVMAVLGYSSLLINVKRSSGAIAQLSRVPVEIRFWLRHLFDCRGIILMQAGACLIITYLTSIAISEIPLHKDYLVFIGAQLTILVGATAQFSVNKILGEHEFYFNEMFKVNVLLRHFRFLFSITVSSAMLFYLLVFYEQLIWFPMQLSIVLFCIYVIDINSNLFSITWFSLSAISALVLFYF